MGSSERKSNQNEDLTRGYGSAEEQPASNRLWRYTETRSAIAFSSHLSRDYIDKRRTVSTTRLRLRWSYHHLIKHKGIRFDFKVEFLLLILADVGWFPLSTAAHEWQLQLIFPREQVAKHIVPRSICHRWIPYFGYSKHPSFLLTLQW